MSELSPVRVLPVIVLRLLKTGRANSPTAVYLADPCVVTEISRFCSTVIPQVWKLAASFLLTCVT